VAHRRLPRRHRGGRKFDLNARRRATTRAGRAGPPDRGSALLLQKRVALHGRADLPLDPAAVLLARDLIDKTQFDTLGVITAWLQQAARAWGSKDGSVAGLWAAIAGGLIATYGGRPTATPTGSDQARYRLARALGKLDGCRTLVVEIAEGRAPPLVIRAAERTLTMADVDMLARLRDGLDRVALRR